MNCTTTSYLLINTTLFKIKNGPNCKSLGDRLTRPKYNKNNYEY